MQEFVERIRKVVARHAGLAGRDDQVGLELLEPGHHHRVGVRRDEDLEPAAGKKKEAESGVLPMVVQGKR